MENPYYIKPHWYMVAGPLLAAGIPGLALLILGLVSNSSAWRLALLIPALLLLQWPVRRALRWAGLSYSLDGTRVEVRRGVLRKKVIRIPVNSIYNFALRQPAPMGAILNFGFVKLITNGPHGEVMCEYVPKCRQFIAKIYDAEGKYEEGLPGPDVAC